MTFRIDLTVFVICILGLGSGMLKGSCFNAEALPWLDCGLSIHNTHEDAAFAKDIEETVYPGTVPLVRFDLLLPMERSKDSGIED